MRQGSKDKIMHGLSAVQAARSVLTDEQAAEDRTFIKHGSRERPTVRVSA